MSLKHSVWTKQMICSSQFEQFYFSRRAFLSPRPIKTPEYRFVIVLMFYRVFNLKYIITSEPAGVLLSVGSAQRAIPIAHKEQSGGFKELHRSKIMSDLSGNTLLFTPLFISF